MSSTRLRSEEIYRERITSDSLFVARTNQPADANSANANAAQQQPSRQEQQDIFSPAQSDSVFENDDLFGPPPLPSKSDSKRATKSKVSSLFDDSDSGDELFSAASSGSRSQKSTDFFAAASNDRAKPLPKSGGLFDDDVDIFGGKDAPEVDLFGVTPNSRTRDVASDDLFGNRGQDSTAAKNSNAGKCDVYLRVLCKNLYFDLRMLFYSTSKRRKFLRIFLFKIPDFFLRIFLTV